MAFTDGLSTLSRALLRERGWYAGRVVDLSEVRLKLAALGMPLNAPAEEMLLELLGLSLPAWDGGFWDIDPITEMYDYLYPSVVPAILGLYPEPLCPVGYQEGCCLFVSNSGTTLWLSEQFASYSVGPRIREAIHGLIEKKSSLSDGESDAFDIPEKVRASVVWPS